MSGTGAYISYNAHFVIGPNSCGMILILVLAMQLFVEVTRYLFSLPDVQGHYLLSEHFSRSRSQDACTTSCKGGLAAN